MFKTSKNRRINPAMVSTIDPSAPGDVERGFPFVASLTNGDNVFLTEYEANRLERAVDAHNDGLAKLQLALHDMMAQTA